MFSKSMKTHSFFSAYGHRTVVSLAGVLMVGVVAFSVAGARA
jgi:hypothetical protein